MKSTLTVLCDKSKWNSIWQLFPSVQLDKSLIFIYNLSLAVKYLSNRRIRESMKRRMIFSLIRWRSTSRLIARFNQRIVVCCWGEADICSPNNVIGGREGEIQFVFNFIPNNAWFDYPFCLTRPASSRLINASDSTWRSPAIRFIPLHVVVEDLSTIQTEFCFCWNIVIAGNLK